MADKEHLRIINQGVDAWNEWRRKNPQVRPDFSKADLGNNNLIGADLSGADLFKADLNRADLSEANLSKAELSHANLNVAHFFKANLSGANFTRADLSMADLSVTNLSKADLSMTNLYEANLSKADLSMAELLSADLSDANLSGANLSGASLSFATLSGTNFENADLTDCNIFAISAWNLKINEKTKQSNLRISRLDEPSIMVDDLEVAQFISLLLHNEKIRHVIDTITSKIVLILGRFSDERKAVLDAIRDELRKRDYLPILFDFDKPHVT